MADSPDSPVDVTLEDHLEHTIEVYKPFLVHHLDCVELLPYMPFLRESAARIRKLKRNGQLVESATLFFEKLKVSDEVGRYASFRDALGEAEQEIVKTVLEGGSINDYHNENMKLIEIFSKPISERLDPIVMMHHLRSKEILTENDESEIRHISRDYSRFEAVLTLLHCVFRRKIEWYNVFMAVMYDMNPNLVKEVDPEFVEKHLAHQSTSEKQLEDDMDMGTIVEAPMEVTGDGCYSVDNMAANDGDVGDTMMDNSYKDEMLSQAGLKEEESQARRKLFSTTSSNALPQNITGDFQNNLCDEQKVPKPVKSVTEFMDIPTDGWSMIQSPHGDQPTSVKLIEPSTQQMEPTVEVGDTSNIEELSPPCPDDSMTPPTPLVLRPYQEELAQPSLRGSNTIICAPTGSGKTFVAAKIMQEHLQKPGVRKIIFFANQVALVDQQFKVIKEHLPRDVRIQKLSSDTEEALRVPLAELVKRNDILFMTPQILVDALRLEGTGVSSLSEFTMLVFDECHHTNSRHPFNRIMFNYMDLKLNESIEDDRRQLPQIVGLTASVGVGKAKSIPGAMDHIQKLCANLDAFGGVSTVRKTQEDLAKHARTVGVDVIKTNKRKEDKFRYVIATKLMEFIEKMMIQPDKVDQVQGRPRFVDSLQPPVERGGDQYTIWVSTLKREVANIEDQNVRRFFFSCRRMLELYNKALAINEDCRTLDALRYLEKEIDTLYSSSVVMDETDLKLKEQFEKLKPVLLDAARSPNCVNPKLTSLCRMIMEAFDIQRESRCMVFVKTRDLAVALKCWMEEDPNLSYLKPGMFTGQNASADKGGMTRNEQLDAAQLFRQGNHKIIIATSVAEEGMDFSQCNLVIRYEYVTNEIALVQARGRARAEDSRFVVLTSNQQGAAEKEGLNLIREMMMNEALVRLQASVEENPRRFREEILSLQKEAKAERDHESRNRKGRFLSDDEFEMRCQKCDQLACFSTDIRTIKETNHIIIEPDFASKINVKPHPKPGNMGFEMKKQNKIYCKKCGLDWGIGVFYRNATFPVVKIESFVAIDTMGRRDSPRKWKNAPFKVNEISHEEMTNYKSLIA
ncbi:antiviral innate immune response receptor RIG-I-like [Haliotis rufescens]|uniref:antiviral innate immune response receptor RIG-I-like n=1 Tax=Haliotis rufescens TaxID=6454 RepID=UPI00201F9476|nr:antiviral innate immune response receptor RIG-I-like [Haliotis rufescens]